MHTLLLGKGYCPEKWTRLKNNCYFLSTNKANWTTSKVNCFSQKAQLIVIEETEELEFLILQSRRFISFWIGLMRRTRKDEWRWVNEEPINKTWWTLGNNTEGDCACIAQESLKAQTCTTEQYWICKMTAGY
ncbi:CD209 antigen-like protein 2 [Erpetoichthys calabaricus]|uniref:CD209 antigen-like protein 2 n=1 Tax=Erpetoichthys calabaricus TaxID=27687 RepID=UPI002234B629|nr:CD209 antigen-like protein 2 [Erpetoichthys calabaricus]